MWQYYMCNNIQQNLKLWLCSWFDDFIDKFDYNNICHVDIWLPNIFIERLLKAMSKCIMHRYTTKKNIYVASSHANALRQKIEFD
jgi:hypothetical protein